MQLVEKESKTKIINKYTSILLLWRGLNYLKAAEPLQGDSSLLTTLSLGVPCIHLIQPLKDKRLGGPWSNPVVFNQGPLVWVKPLTLKSHQHSEYWN